MAKFLENYIYEGLTFKITEDEKFYYADCEEIHTYSDDLLDLKTIKIPQKYYSCREFKL